MAMAIRSAHTAGIGYGFSQLCISASSYTLCFWYAVRSRLVLRGDATFGEMLRAFCVLVNAAIGVGQAAAFFPTARAPTMRRSASLL